MYLAQFDLAGSRIVQGRVCLESLSNAWNRLGSTAVATLLQARGAIGVQPLDMSLRIEFSTACKLRYTWTITAPAAGAAMLHQYLSTFSRLESLGVGEVHLPHNAAEFDQMVADCPSARSRLVCDGLKILDYPVACPIRAVEWLDTLITECALRGAPLVYQANIATSDAPVSLLRQARLTAAELGLRREIPDPIRAHQARLAAGLSTTNYLMEEFLATVPEQARWLNTSLRRLFQTQSGFMCVSDPGIDCCLDAYDVELDNAMHSVRFDELPWESHVAQSVEPARVVDILSWSPAAHTLSAIHWITTNESDTSRAHSPAPKPESLFPFQGPFKFVSYSHSDTDSVLPVIRTAQQSGIPLWWDHYIPGGSEWDTELENRIRNSTGLIAFLSDSAINSKYVRREIKYADAIGKPILAIDLHSAIQLAHGLDMLMRQYQRLPINHPALIDALKG